jgi:uncharacterized membrane protein YeaQ/YmgE (transglycosylase-associated protein family)
MTLAQIEPYKIYIILGLIGLVAGWLSGLLLGGGGLLRNLVVGVLGAFVGGLLVENKLLNLPKMPVVDQIPYGNQIVVATVGAILITIFARVIAGSR